MIKTDYSKQSWNDLLKLAGMRQVLKGLKSSELKRTNITRLLEEQDLMLTSKHSPIYKEITTPIDISKDIEIKTAIANISMELEILKTLINKQ